MALSRTALSTGKVEQVLYEENGHEFIFEVGIYSNYRCFWHRKGIYYTKLVELSVDSVCDPIDSFYEAIDRFNEIMTRGN